MKNEKYTRRAEWLGLVALAGLAVFFVAASWRKWPDTLIDFSRELYVPWRVAGGALLYRDVHEIFGPLSQYVNAGLFAVFGPGLMVLVAANLAVFAAILAVIYALFRRAWGAGAALAAAAVFIAVFGFSQFITIGNYNYATPYCHEATHGMLACLLLVAVLSRWVEAATPGRSFLAGGLFGLTAVLKPEIMLAGGVVTSAAVAMRSWQRRPWSNRATVAWAVGAVLPTAAFAAYFATAVPWTTALKMACRVWMSADVTTRQINEQVQIRFLGFDQPQAHLIEHVEATLLALLLFAGIAAMAWLADRAPRPWLRWVLSGALIGGVLWLACAKIHWINIGHCLLGLTLVYIGSRWGGAPLRRQFDSDNGKTPAEANRRRRDAPPHLRSSNESNYIRLLIAVLAAALMARMLLNGRIYHYGFFEAALAAMMVPAIMIGELPEPLRAGSWGRSLIITCSLLLIVPGVVKLAAASQAMLRAKTYSIETGADRFYTFPPQALGTGDIVRVMSDWLRKTPPDQTAIVLPEGEMINYLARRPSPIAPYAFFAAATSNGREARIVGDLRRHPPDWIVIVSRDIRDNGVKFYGESDGEGRAILAWVAANYAPAMSVGGNPLDPDQCGGIVLRKVER